MRLYRGQQEETDEIKTTARKNEVIPLLMAAAIATCLVASVAAPNGRGTGEGNFEDKSSIPASSEAGTEDVRGGDGAEAMDEAGKADEPGGRRQSRGGGLQKYWTRLVEDGKVKYYSWAIHSYTYTNDLPGVFYQDGSGGADTRWMYMT